MKISPSLREKIKSPSFIGFCCALVIYVFFIVGYVSAFYNSNKITAVAVNGNSTITMRIASVNSGGDQTRFSKAVPKPPKPKKHPPKPKKHHRPTHKIPEPQREAIREPKPTEQKIDQKQQASNTDQQGAQSESLAYNQGVSNEFLSKIRIAISNNNIYPRIARIRGLEGEVMVEFILNIDGSIEGLKIIQSTAGDILNNSALKAVNNASKEFPIPKQKVRIKVPIIYSLART